MRYVIAAFLSCFPALALAATPPTYLAVEVGASQLVDADNTGDGTTLQSTYDLGFMAAFRAGRRFANGFRAEWEVSYRQSHVDEVKVRNDGGRGAALGVGSLNGLKMNAGGKETALAFMVNGLYDFTPQAAVHPYLGAGIGIARIALDDVTLEGVDFVDDSDVQFAYQAMAGVEFDVTQNFGLFLDYRYFAALDPSFHENAGGRFDSEYATHNLSVGIRYLF